MILKKKQNGDNCFFPFGLRPVSCRIATEHVQRLLLLAPEKMMWLTQNIIDSDFFKQV